MIKPLTSLRFFAALLVFACHSPLTFFAAFRLHTGEAGVGFFFVLSGFILVYAHSELLKGRVTFSQVKDFWAARFARIYPVQILSFSLAMYMLVRGVGFGWFPTDIHRNVTALVTQLTLTQSWIVVDSLVNYNGIAWSVSDEAFFYAVFPAVALALFLIVARTRPWSAVAIAGALWALELHLALTIPDRQFIYTFPPVRLIDFTIGACFGVLFTSAPRKKSPGFAMGTLLEIAAVGIVIAAICFTPQVPAPLQYVGWLTPFWVLVIYIFASGNGAVSRLLSAAALIYLGEISYSFYMLHVLILTAIFDRTWTFPTVFVTSALSLILCIAVSAIVYERFEKPLRKRIRSLFTEAAPVPAVA